MNEFIPDHPDLGLPPDTPAVLVPLSDSAIHSFKLFENEKRLAKIPSTTLLNRLASTSVELRKKLSPRL